MNFAGNLICGQVMGDTAKQLSERFGKIIQPRTSLSTNSSDTSVSHSLQMDAAIPQSKISSLASGEFEGMVAEDPTRPIGLKSFHAKIQNSLSELEKEKDNFQKIPIVRKIGETVIQKIYLQIRQDIQNIAEFENEKISNNPELNYLMTFLTLLKSTAKRIGNMLIYSINYFLCLFFRPKL